MSGWGRWARKVIFVLTDASDEEDMGIRYQSVNRYYRDKKFPYCFDMVQLSPALLRRSLELMGFTEIHPIENIPNGMPDAWFNRFKGYLAIRGDEASFGEKRWSHDALQEDFGPVPTEQAPQLVDAINGYNIVAFRGKFLGIPQTTGAMDLSQLSDSEIYDLEGIFVRNSAPAVRQAIEDQDQQAAVGPLSPKSIASRLKNFFSP